MGVRRRVAAGARSGWKAMGVVFETAVGLALVGMLLIIVTGGEGSPHFYWAHSLVTLAIVAPFLIGGVAFVWGALRGVPA